MAARTPAAAAQGKGGEEEENLAACTNQFNPKV
jgi:hypothetical protein